MADKRRSSKQRRQARNRAQRDALAARSETASRNVASAPPAATSSRSSIGRTGETHGSGSASSGAEGGDRTDAGTLGGAVRRGGGLFGLRNRRPGDLAVFLALVFSLGSFLLLALFRVPVDDRGEPLPNRFRGLTLEIRSMLEGRPIEAESERVFTAIGPSILLMMIVPVIIAAWAFWANRTRSRRSRNLTIAMVLMAVVVIFSGSFGTFYMASLIALAVGSFQVRKHEMPTRPGQRPGQRGARPQRDDEVIDVDEVQTDEERALAELEQELSQETDAREQGNGSGRR